MNNKRNWSDILVFNFAGCSHVLQARKTWTGKVKFRISNAGNFLGNYCDTLTEDHMKKVGLWNQQQEKQ